jgi:tRNA(adenine34) deaminase
LGILDQDWTPLQKIQDAEYHLGADWLDEKKAPEVFSYNRDILWAVQKLLKLNKKKRVLR